MPDPFSLDFPDDGEAFAEAVQAFMARVPVDPEVWARLNRAERERAFKVANVMQGDVLAETMRALESSMQNGTPFADFKRDIGPALEEAWQGSVADPSSRLETIFRTNINTAFNAGHFQQMSKPSVKKARPYWKFIDVDDQRESQFCKPLHGVIRPQDDPFWQTHWPPLHFNCRSTVVAITESEALASGVTGVIPHTEVMPGFGHAPTSSAPAWDPMDNERPADVQSVLAQKLDERVPRED